MLTAQPAAIVRESPMRGRRSPSTCRCRGRSTADTRDVGLGGAIVTARPGDVDVRGWG
jgi:hypothetical protein